MEVEKVDKKELEKREEEEEEDEEETTTDPQNPANGEVILSYFCVIIKSPF